MNRKTKTIALNDVFEINEDSCISSESILSLAEDIGKEEERFRKGFIRKIYLNIGTWKEKIEEEKEFIFDEKLDVPKNVLATYKDRNGNLILKTEFKQRTNGIIPNATMLSSDFMRNKFPMFLLSYYESMLR